jgi:hypothetical protein
MSKNVILPKKKPIPPTENIEDLIIQKMESKTTELAAEEDMGGDPQRVNFMMPRYLYDMMKDKLKRKGDKMSNYLIGLVRKDLGDD